MAAAVRAKGLPVALVMYDGEGHGFRRADTIAASLNTKLSFLGQVFGFAPAGVRKNYYAEVHEDALVMWAHDIDTDAYGTRLDGIESRFRPLGPPRWAYGPPAEPGT